MKETIYQRNGIRSAAALSLCFAGCVSTPPTSIGPDTYYASKSTAGGEMGNTEAAVGHLIVKGNKFCSSMGKQFQLVSQKENPSSMSSPVGAASITFKCLPPQ
jgi:hypothetical protein